MSDERETASDRGTEDEGSLPLLFATGGQRAPADLGRSLRQLLALPGEVRQKLGAVLLPNLEPMPEDQVESRIARLCRRHDLKLEVVGPAVKATVWLFGQAASHNVNRDQLAQDLSAIGCDGLKELLLPLYDEAFTDLRLEAVKATIAAHGKVMAGIEWRIDTLGSSNRGRQLNVPVALLTFHYLDGSRSDRITLQMLPDMVHSLRDVCDTLVKK